MTNIRTKITTEVTIDLDIETGAKWFSGLSDDEMCRFFVAVAKEAQSWDGAPGNMWCYVGGHLADCECSTEDARDMIRSIAWHMEERLRHPLERNAHVAEPMREILNAFEPFRQLAQR